MPTLSLRHKYTPTHKGLGGLCSCWVHLWALIWWKLIWMHTPIWPLALLYSKTKGLDEWDDSYSLNTQILIQSYLGLLTSATKHPKYRNMPFRIPKQSLQVALQYWNINCYILKQQLIFITESTYSIKHLPFQGPTPQPASDISVKQLLNPNHRDDNPPPECWTLIGLSWF